MKLLTKNTEFKGQLKLTDRWLPHPTSAFANGSSTNAVQLYENMEQYPL